MPTVRSHDGLEIAYSHRPGDRPSVVFVHATGFCKEVWWPVVNLVPESVEIIAMDQRGHGESGVGARPFDWWDLGRDVQTVVAAHPDEGRIGVGHSSGAAALVMAEVLAPGTFNGLVLVEPIILPPPRVRGDDDRLARGTRRRRPSFPSHEAAMESFRGRGPFAGWTDAALRAYVANGFHEDRSGAWSLRCTPETEAEFYATARLHDTWERLGEVECPAVVLGGEETTAPVGEVLEELAARLGNGTLRIVPETGHFLPMERPEVVAGTITDVMETGPGRPLKGSS